MKIVAYSRPEDVGPALAAAAEAVRAGGVVLIPTESYYGLAVDPCHAGAVNRVLELKGRPDGLGLPVVCCDWQQVESLVDIPPVHRVKLSRLWPAARDDTLAIRIPDHDLLRVLLYRVGPLTATSANRHGDRPCSEVAAALSSLVGAPDLVLDGGELPGGRVSTLVDLSTEEGRVIRRGAVGWEQSLDLEQWVIQES